MSASQYGTKLAVATAGCGSKYPKHVDNSGLPDQRKLTMIYYLNPRWAPAMGGELRLHLVRSRRPVISGGISGGISGVFLRREIEWQGSDGVDEPLDLTPEGDRLVMFWSDLCVHEVLANLAPRGDREHGDRYAMTLWFVSDDSGRICDNSGPAWQVVLDHFPRDGGRGLSKPPPTAQAEAVAGAVAALSGRELCDLASQAGVAIGAVGVPQSGDAAEGSEWWDTVATHPTLTPSERVRSRGAVEGDVTAILTK